MRLPPLNALHAFEAAARFGSFTRAAEELSVTQSAVSHQIKGLEARLGIALFARRGRHLVLTENGAFYHGVVQGAFERLRQGTERLTRPSSPRRLVVTVAPSLAANWLVPRIGRFRARHPDIDLAISATDRLVDFVREEVDCGIRFGNGRWPGVIATQVLKESLFPVASPKLIAGGPPLANPESLKHYELLHDEMREDWRMWLMAAGVRSVDPTRGPSFSHSNLVLQAAVDGQGVALGRSAMVAADLAAGRLVKLFDLSVPVHWAHYFVCPESRSQDVRIAALRAWLLEEAK